VLLAMGLPHQRARASIRVSLGKQTTQEDVDFAGKVIPETVARLREISPMYQKQTVS
jgi:cysteine desulfurase